MSYTAQTTLKRVQYDPAPDGTVRVTSFFEKTVTNDDDPDDVLVSPWRAVVFDMPAELATQIETIATEAHDDIIEAMREAKSADSEEIKPK